MSNADAASLDDAIARCTDRAVELRHEFHRHPELSFAEHRTTATITERMGELGWNLEPCPTPTGAVATLATGRPGRTVMLRADIDALPVTEERDFPYRSAVEGVMHACGHDVHTAGLLGAAEILASRRDALVGTYVAVFQPAEEGLGGARAMVDGGVLETHGIERLVGVHVSSMAPLGVAALRDGVLMSEFHAFRITLSGRGGHGAMASVAGNVVLAVSALAQRVSEIVTGLSFEDTDCACSAGVIVAGTAPNVVPRTATLRGSVRTFTDDQRETALGRLHAVVGDLEREFAVRGTVTIEGSAPAVRNDPAATDLVERAARTVPGLEAVLRIAPTTPSDDVSEFMNRVPGCYLFVGGALEDGTSGAHHSPDFAVDDRSVPIVAGVLAAGAIALASEKAGT